ncbi:hypothetical protein OIU85_008285 [Salix viminalis]|uniref:Uncharacterized protein n=1 Tax=Salix viminalis TaxID=40686 RepID=A0A9Q0NXG4_SALVM|nr:hypothetical protein OIU85_008285 [Salix viminalis]
MNWMFQFSVEPVNDPPVIKVPKFITLKSNEDESLIFDKEIDKFEFSVGDPDLLGYPWDLIFCEWVIAGNESGFIVTFSVEVDKGFLVTRLAAELLKTTELKVMSSYQWQPIQTYVSISRHFMVKANGVRFRGPINECNSVMQQLSYDGRGGDAILTVKLNDMGHYGCSSDCTDKIAVPLYAEATVHLIRRGSMSSLLANTLGSAILVEFIVVFSLGGILLFFTCKCTKQLLNERRRITVKNSQQSSVQNSQKKSQSTDFPGDTTNFTGCCSSPFLLSGQPPNFRQRSYRRLGAEGGTGKNTSSPPRSSSSHHLQTPPGLTPLNLKLVFDITQISKLPSSRFQQFLSLGQEAVDDLKTLVSLDENNRVVFSCQKSSLQFAGTVLLSGFLLISSIRVLFKLVVGFKRKFGAGKNPNFVVRRDRSLGGKEVIVAVNEQQREESKRPKRLANPVEIPGLVDGLGFERGDWRRHRVGNQQKLPKWWLDSGSFSGRVVGPNQEEYQREANRLIRAITDYRTRGKDVKEHDIIQLRRICRTSGVKASFNTTNTRDAFYRASIDVVLNVCSSAPSYSTSLEIDGEDPRHFIAGLAGNIGLESIRAARMVSAAVASRTRSCFLQAWVILLLQPQWHPLVVLAGRWKFKANILKPCMSCQRYALFYKHFLLKSLHLKWRCEESQRSAADALGLMPSPEGAVDQ